jgi:hypothetical protein
VYSLVFVSFNSLDSKIPPQLSLESFSIGQFTLPNHEDPPSGLSQCQDVFSISFNIPAEFCLPEINVALRHVTLPAPFVTVPEATMDENDGLSFSEDNIWLSREVLPVQPESKPRAMQHGANLNFRRSVAPFDLPHIPTASFPIEPVHLLIALS